MSTLMLKGPYWVVACQHRRVLWAVPALLGASLIAMIALRAWSRNPEFEPIDASVEYEVWEFLRLCIMYSGRTLPFLPLLVGALVAGPMVARELESGTWRLALTQSTTAKAWLGSKVLVAAVVSVFGSLALIGIYRLGWVRVSDTSSLHWYERGVYEATGPVLVGYCLLGVALGTLVGQLIRRTLPAMAVTGLLTGLVLLVLGALRWSFLPMVTATAPYTVEPESLLSSSVKRGGTGLISTTGERIPGYYCAPEAETRGFCRADVDVTASYADFHPSSHYWPIQLIETSILLALAAAALYAAFRLVRKRHP
ncbi:ABC transporter permease [Streptomyces sp. NPDC099050]|uniref:ABC transporter permease n=1 Tax=Streptomyces sp. NPDC099050 TaxID=3366100 RepID=UPI003807EC39